MECYEEIVQVVPGLALGFMEAAVLASISVAISTRLSMIPNLVICISIYVLGLLKNVCGCVIPSFARRPRMAIWGVSQSVS